jgi:hypothetical protein
VSGPSAAAPTGADLHLAARQLLHLVGEDLDGAALVALFIQAVAEADQARLDVLGDGPHRSGQGGGGQGGENGTTKHFHESLQVKNRLNN